jgi:hypothetical protein
MFAFRCLQCGCLHGWIDDPAVVKVQKETTEPIVAGSLEPGTTGVNATWYCPRCGAEHVTRHGEQPVNQPPPDEIRLRAYYLWEAAQRPPGDGRAFWLLAEEELRHKKTFALVRVR